MRSFNKFLALLALLTAMPIVANAQVFDPAHIVQPATTGNCTQIGSTPSRDIADSGSPCTNALAVVNGDVVTGQSSGTGVKDSGTLLSSLAPKASPTFTGTATLPTTTQVAGTMLFTGTAPTPTGTGTPTIQASSTDAAGEVTAGSSATSVVITFAGTYTNAPYCNVTDQSQITSFAYAITNTAITITQTSTSGNKIDYQCHFRG